MILNKLIPLFFLVWNECSCRCFIFHSELVLKILKSSPQYLYCQKLNWLGINGRHRNFSSRIVVCHLKSFLAMSDKSKLIENDATENVENLSMANSHHGNLFDQCANHHIKTKCARTKLTKYNIYAVYVIYRVSQFIRYMTVSRHPRLVANCFKWNDPLFH